MKQNKNIDLGKYDLNKLLRNPGLIHNIQDSLMGIKGDGLFTKTIREGAKKDIKECIRMIVQQYGCNAAEIKRIVGRETLDMIDEFEGITLADDLKNVL